MTLSLFEAYGIEIESAVVDAQTLDVRSLVDELLRAGSGGQEWVEDVDDGPIGWSNELVSHVVELKTAGPVPTLDGVAADFTASTGRLNALLGRWNARLMPTGMHPWMDPARETKLWPHDAGPIYRAYDRLFDCRRHGWANVQSVHLNLPFADEAEFGRLMAAARLVLPLIPGLSASSPITEGSVTGMLDTRLEHYRTNSARIPEMAGGVIPEPIFDVAEYRETVLGGLDRALGAAGAAPELRGGHEWTNARGAIARFDRMAIEIRLIDAQECAASDLAMAAAVTGVVRGLVEERWSSGAEQRGWASAPLASLFARSLRDGPRTEVDPELARVFGAPGPLSLAALWRRLVEETFQGPQELSAALQVVLDQGTLAERILAACEATPDRARLREVYGALCDSLAAGRPFRP